MQRGNSRASVEVLGWKVYYSVRMDNLCLGFFFPLYAVGNFFTCKISLFFNARSFNRISGCVRKKLFFLPNIRNEKNTFSKKAFMSLKNHSLEQKKKKYWNNIILNDKTRYYFHYRKFNRAPVRHAYQSPIGQRNVFRHIGSSHFVSIFFHSCTQSHSETNMIR